MAWKFQKKAIDLEKAMGADTTSSFGSVKHNGIAIPPKAYSAGDHSPTEVKFEQSGSSSPQFTSSFPTSEQRERKMKRFVMRHAFLIIVAVLFVLVLGITAIIVLIRMRYNNKNFNPLVDQVSQNAGSSSAITPLATSTSSI